MSPYVFLNTYLADARTPSRLIPVVFVVLVALPWPRGGVLDDVAEDCADLLGAEVARGELGPDDGAAQVPLEAGQGLIDRRIGRSFHYTEAQK